MMRLAEPKFLFDFATVLSDIIRKYESRGCYLAKRYKELEPGLNQILATWRISELVSDGAGFFRALAPMVRIIDRDFGHMLIVGYCYGIAPLDLTPP
jgi:hypothetical protein